MDKREIETRLLLGLQQQTPDMPDALAAACSGQLERNNTMQPDTRISLPSNPAPAKRKRPAALRWVAAGIAAVLVLSIGIYMVAGLFAVDAVISIDANPSILLRTNSAAKVLSVEARNPDAQALLDGADLKGVPLDDAVYTLLAAMMQNGYIDDVHNSVLVSVESAKKQDGNALKQQLSNDVNRFFRDNRVDGAVYSQTLTDDERLQALADQYGISLGKAALIDLLVQQDPRYTFDSFVDTPINDILLLLNAKQTDLGETMTTGQPSSSGYIGEAAAKDIALQAAGVTESQATCLHVDLDWDDGRMVYEVEFLVGNVEYDYEIDAVTGRVLEFDSDIEDDIPANAGQSPQGQTAGTGGSGHYIGSQAALDIALRHAGVSAAAIYDVSVEFDWENGYAVYDVEFKSGNMEYDYEIDAVTGDILKSNREYDD